ncbi:MAG TPA: ATP-binding protein [Woeseiaceae bacterium]|nr:ATP-binding protein [Woeseiaceae bacterium]
MRTDTLRLQQLYEISTVLTRFDEDVLSRVAALLADSLRLRCVIMVLEDRSGTRNATTLWPPHSDDSAEFAAQKTRAERSYAYLAGEAATLPGSPEDTLLAGRPEFLALPLVVQRSPMFGVLQVETSGPCGEEALLFANTVANQLAVALDRRLDIEERQAAVEAKRNRAEEQRDEALVTRWRYEALIDHLDHAFVWQADAESLQVFYVSARAEMLLGYPRERWVAEPDFWDVCVHAEDRGTLFDAFKMALLTGNDQRCEHRAITAEGRGIWLHTGVHLTDDRSGAPVLQGVSFDVTPEKEAAAAKQEQLEFSRAITQGLGEGVIAVDLHGRITFLNPAAAKLLAVRQDEAVDADIETLLQLHSEAGPVSREDRPAFVVMRTGKASKSMDYVIVRRRDGDLPVNSTAAPLWREGEISGAVIVFKDITERKRMEEAQREADRRKNEFLAMLGHELRNPLAPITNAAQVLRVGDPASKELAASIIERQTSRMGRMIDELLDVARIATGRIGLHRQRMDLRNVVKSAVETVRPLINRRGHELEVPLGPEPLWVHADVDRLEQVTANLLDNAAKYTAPGGHLAVSAERDGEDVVLRVRDNGPGIPAELLSRMFELFSQGDRPVDRSQGGLGIGLALVKQIVDMHGGTVKAETLPGGGSEFTVRLALADDESESTAGAGAGELAAQSARQLRILVVDDNLDTAESLAMLLRESNHEVQVAYDGASAMKVAADFHPHTVFLDIGLPEIDGYEVARRMRKHPELCRAVLVALTGYGREMDRQQSREAGFDHHLTKPASLSDIHETLQSDQPVWT